MKFILFGAALSLAMAVTGVRMTQNWIQQQDEPGGFDDWVKDPKYKKAAAEYFKARDALQVPADLSDAAIQRMVDRLFIEADEDFNVDRLKLVGARAMPFLVRALNDPKTTTLKFGKDVLSFHSPLERICNLIAPFGPPTAVPALTRLLAHDDEYFRLEAVLALGNIGTEEAAPPLLKILQGKDNRLQEYALMGLHRGVQGKCYTPAFAKAMFPTVTQFLNRSECRTAAWILLAYDAPRALPILLSPQYFSSQNESVSAILWVLNQSDRKIPLATLLPLLTAVKLQLAQQNSKYSQYKLEQAYANGLIAYAMNPDAATESLLRTELKSPAEDIQAAAAAGLAIAAGVENAMNVVLAALDAQGFEKLTPQQQHYVAVALYNLEVNNGGHLQYFVNSAGEQWQAALAGLAAIGAPERAAILCQATLLFGKKGPAVDHDERHAQLARFRPKEDEAMHELDSRYYKLKENVDALLSQYAIEHKSHFVKQPK